MTTQSKFLLGLTVGSFVAYALWRRRNKPPRKLVWISGCSGSGKSFTGDYLETCCGFFHVDGDECFHSKDAECIKLKDGLVQAFYKFWFDEQSAPAKLWHPYYAFLAQRVSAAPAGKDVVVTGSVYHREVRDHLRQLFPSIIYIQLNCAEYELVNRHFKRFEKYAEAKKQTIHEAWFELYGKEQGEYRSEKFMKQTLQILRGLQPLQPEEALCYSINSTIQDGSLFERLHQTIGLSPPLPLEDIPIHFIAQKNYNRWKG